VFLKRLDELDAVARLSESEGGQPAQFAASALEASGRLRRAVDRRDWDTALFAAYDLGADHAVWSYLVGSRARTSIAQSQRARSKGRPVSVSDEQIRTAYKVWKRKHPQSSDAIAIRAISPSLGIGEKQTRTRLKRMNEKK
jgi:hypothetical protein